MSKTIGSLYRVGIAIETTPGTAMSAPQFFVETDDFNVVPKIEVAIKEQLTGRPEKQSGNDKVLQWSEFDFSFRARELSLGAWLKLLLGQEALTLATPNSTHTFSLTSANSSPLTFTLFTTDISNTESYVYAGCVIDTFDLEYKEKGYVMAKVTAKGKSEQVLATAPTYPAVSDQGEFISANTVLNIGASSTTPNFVADIKLRQGTISFKKAIIENVTQGSLEIRDFLNGRFEIEASLELVYDGRADYREKFKVNTNQYYQLVSTSTITATPPTFTCNIVQGNITEYEEPITLGDLLYQTIKITGNYNFTIGAETTLVLTNSRGTIY